MDVLRASVTLAAATALGACNSGARGVEIVVTGAGSAGSAYLVLGSATCNPTNGTFDCTSSGSGSNPGPIGSGISWGSGGAPPSSDVYPASGGIHEVELTTVAAVRDGSATFLVDSALFSQAGMSTLSRIAIFTPVSNGQTQAQMAVVDHFTLPTTDEQLVVPLAAVDIVDTIPTAGPAVHFWSLDGSPGTPGDDQCIAWFAPGSGSGSALDVSFIVPGSDHDCDGATYAAGTECNDYWWKYSGPMPGAPPCIAPGPSMAGGGSSCLMAPRTCEDNPGGSGGGSGSCVYDLGPGAQCLPLGSGSGSGLGSGSACACGAQPDPLSCLSDVFADFGNYCIFYVNTNNELCNGATAGGYSGSISPSTDCTSLTFEAISPFGTMLASPLMVGNGSGSGSGSGWLVPFITPATGGSACSVTFGPTLTPPLVPSTGSASASFVLDVLLTTEVHLEVPLTIFVNPTGSATCTDQDISMCGQSSSSSEFGACVPN